MDLSSRHRLQLLQPLKNFREGRSAMSILVQDLVKAQGGGGECWMRGLEECVGELKRSVGS